MSRKWVYKIIYPNGKIYVGKDLTGNANYFGSANSKLIEQDFTFEQLQFFSISREILWFSDNATDDEVHQKEMELIVKLQANNPKIGYNRRPRFKS